MIAVTGPVCPTDLSKYRVCPPGLDMLLDTGQLVIHKANLRHNVGVYSTEHF